MEEDDPDTPDRSERLERCAHCGSTLPMEEWHPIATSADDDGATQVLSFCDESCKDAVMNDETNAASTE